MFCVFKFVIVCLFKLFDVIILVFVKLVLFNILWVFLDRYVILLEFNLIFIKLIVFFNFFVILIVVGIFDFKVWKVLIKNI